MGIDVVPMREAIFGGLIAQAIGIFFFCPSYVYWVLLTRKGFSFGVTFMSSNTADMPDLEDVDNAVSAESGKNDGGAKDDENKEKKVEEAGDKKEEVVQLS